MATETDHSDGTERQPVPRLLIVEDDAAQLQALSAIMRCGTVLRSRLRTGVIEYGA